MGAIESVAAVIAPDCIGVVALATLNCFPQIVIEDAEPRNFYNFPEGHSVRPRHALSTLWIFYIGAAVPFDPTDVEAIVQYARASIALPTDRGVAPLAPVRTWNTYSVKSLCDRSRGRAGGEVAKNASDHLCLSVVH